MSNPSVYNFGAGPGCLPQAVLSQIRDDIPNWRDGLSVMEVGHRVPVFTELAEQIEADLRELLSIPDDFDVLFMHGGARTQYALIPLNLLNGAKHADYLVTGHWSALAFEDAKQYCEPHIVASGEGNNFTQIPPEETWSLSDESAYIHYVDNETIQGIEFQQAPNSTSHCFVSDMTSSILTKPIDFSRFGLIYASAQKNLGIAGITVVIVRKSLLGKAHPLTPLTLNYAVSAKSKSMANTPPVFAWYVLGLMLQWAKAQGGLNVLSALCQEKSTLLYDFIDNSEFYSNPVSKTSRSRINIPFRLPTPELESLFISEASQAQLKQLKGHRVVGGCRASLYNAMPLDGVKALVEFMNTFSKANG